MSVEASLYSEHWYRIRSLQPRIQVGVSIRRQVLRGKEWFVFSHPVTGRHHRLNRKAYELVGRLDGEHSLESIWNGLQNTLGDNLPTQDEVIALLAQMMSAGLILFDTHPDWSALKQQQQAAQNRERKSNLNPFSFRIKLLNPSALLDRLAVAQPFVWHPLMLMFCTVLLGWAGIEAIIQWTEIYAYASINLLTPRCLLLSWLAYPFIKALHELAHAMAVRRWGGEVKEAGLGFFVLVPAPYVDASASSAFASKWQRVAVSAAGIVVELTLAAVALAVWSTVENGLVRDLAFAVMVIGGLSTLVFNGNPLLRFDGYFILCDLLELPNLASRSDRWWSHQLRRLFRQGGNRAEEAMYGWERVWVMIYAPSSWIYRIVVSVVILRWITEVSLLLGVVAAVWAAFSVVISPLWSSVQVAFGPSHPSLKSWQPVLATGVVFVLLIAFAVLIPLPSSTVAAGVVWLPEQSQVRTDNDGNVIEVLVQDGQRVRKGQPLIVMEEPALLTKKEGLLARIRATETDKVSGLLGMTLRGPNAHEELVRLHHELSQVEERIEKLTLRAGVDGVFVLPRADELLGRDLQKGTLLAYVLAHDPTRVRAVIAQDDIGRFSAGVRKISVRLAETATADFNARLVQVEPAATTHLPSMALGDKGAGWLVTDPADQTGMTLLEPAFLADVELGDRNVVRTGGRAWVRFEYQPTPLVQTAWWRFRQLFLKTFSQERL